MAHADNFLENKNVNRNSNFGGKDNEKDGIDNIKGYW
jgi:hypothetical protein